MLQTLLANEFKLVVHREQKPMNVFELTVGKGGPKFQKAAGTGKPDCKRTFGATYDHPEKTGPNGNGDGQMHAVCVNMTMADLAEGLPNLAPGYIDRMVVDSTGLKATYDLNLWTNSLDSSWRKKSSPCQSLLSITWKNSRTIRERARSAPAPRDPIVRDLPQLRRCSRRNLRSPFPATWLCARLRT